MGGLRAVPSCAASCELSGIPALADCTRPGARGTGRAPEERNGHVGRGTYFQIGEVRDVNPRQRHVHVPQHAQPMWAWEGAPLVRQAPCWKVMGGIGMGPGCT